MLENIRDLMASQLAGCGCVAGCQIQYCLDRFDRAVEKLDRCRIRRQSITRGERCLFAPQQAVRQHPPPIGANVVNRPEFVQRVSSNDRAPKTRIQRALFKHVGADVTEIAKLVTQMQKG